MVKALIFDWGGVMAPPDNAIGADILHQKYGVDKDLFIQLCNQYEEEKCDTNEEDYYLNNVTSRCNISREAMKNALNAAHPHEVFEIAKSLCGKFPVFILSNQVKFRTDYIKSTFDLSMFKDIFFSNEIGMKKPNKDIFEHVLQKHNLNAQDCLFVDDNKLNVTSSQKLGFNVILFENINQLKTELQNQLNNIKIN